MITREILSNYVQEDYLDKILNDFENFFNSKSQRDQVLFYFKVEKYLTNKTLAEIFPDYQVNTLTQRANNSDYLETTDKEGKYLVYTLTAKGENYINKIINTFLDKNNKYQDYLMLNRKKKYEASNLKDNFKQLLVALIDSGIRPNLEDKIIIDLKLLSEFDFEATELIYANFQESLSAIKVYFQNEGLKDLKDEDILFINPQQTIYREIHDYDREYKGLIYTKGLITSKKEAIVLQTIKLWYNCINESCSYSTEKIGSVNVVKKCPRCKSDVLLISKDTVNHFESKIANIDSGVAFPIIFRGSKAREFAVIGLGDEIEVIGHLEDKVIENRKGEKEEIVKCLVVNSFRKTDFVKDLTKEEIAIAERIIEKNDIKEYLLTPFKEYVESDWFKDLILLQQLTKFNPETKETPINLAIMGEPGVGKNELIKISEKYFPCCDSIVGADITDAGYKGTVNRDTGIKEIGLAKKTQHGTLFFNEFDKFVKSNNNGKKAASQLLNASITEQEIRLNKAGIKLKFEHLDLRHNVVFNPTEEKIADTGKLPHHFMGDVLDKSLLSRMIPIYIPKDKDRSLKVMDLMLEDAKKYKNIVVEDYQILIKYLRSRDVKLSLKAKNKIKGIFKNILERDENSMISPERIAQVLTQISKACARICNNDEVTGENVKEAYDYYLMALKSTGITLDNLEALFQDKTIEEIKTKKEIKLFIENYLLDNEELIIEDFNTKFNTELFNEAVMDLKKLGDYAEFNKGKLKRIK